MINTIYVETDTTLPIRIDYHDNPATSMYNWMFGIFGNETRLDRIRRSSLKYTLGVF